MKHAGIITCAVAVALLACLFAGREPAHWPPPEPTPYQGEAAEPGQSAHSPTALARLVREPENAWSNLAFVLGGALLVSRCREHLARMLGIPLIGVGIGSFLYHASASAPLRQLDVGAMYWLFVLASLYCAAVVLGSLRASLNTHAIWLTLGALGVAIALTLSRNFVVFGFKPLSLTAATIVSSAILLLTLADVARRRENVSVALQFLGIVTAFGVAVYLQLGDRPGGVLYRPGAALQAHAVWHVLAAVAFTWAISVIDAPPTAITPNHAPAS